MESVDEVHSAMMEEFGGVLLIYKELFESILRKYKASTVQNITIDMLQVLSEDKLSRWEVMKFAHFMCRSSVGLFQKRYEIFDRYGEPHSLSHDEAQEALALGMCILPESGEAIHDVEGRLSVSFEATDKLKKMFHNEG